MGGRIRAVVVAVVALVTLCAPAPAGARSGPLVITYEVRGRGNVSSLEDLAATAAAVYADPRGWNLGGSIRFERVETGGAGVPIVQAGETTDPPVEAACLASSPGSPPRLRMTCFWPS